MSGHSKWANIRRKKEKTDSQRAHAFTKLGRELAVVVKMGGGDPEINAKLKDVIVKAKAANMPNDNITRCINKAAGDKDAAGYEEVTYEGYGPAGVAVVVETLTDNRNRTAGDVRHFFDKFGGNLGTTGCVSFMFDKKGLILIEKNAKSDEDQIMMDVLESGADDFLAEEEYFEISTSIANFSTVREYLEKKGYKFESAEITMIPTMYTKITDEKQVILMEKIIDNLEELDDVQNVYHNWDQDEEADEE
jgi:YebC/PmpR family DNA-binding regulatory protein